MWMNFISGLFAKSYGSKRSSLSFRNDEGADFRGIEGFFIGQEIFREKIRTACVDAQWPYA